MLPIRPIIYGGDDVTFVCDGRIAVELARFYMREFEKQTAAMTDVGTAYSCAGIAIVKSHYPFARACDLASQLCSGAKTFVRSAGVSASAIDWHFASAGLAGDMDDIRQRECQTADGLLNLRPIFVTESQTGVRTWKTIQSGVSAFREKQWFNRRNKVKAARDALRTGPNGTRAFCEKYLSSTDQKLPDLHIPDTQSKYQQTGWLALEGGEYRCAYFDSIELADFQIPLKCSEVNATADAAGSGLPKENAA